MEYVYKVAFKEPQLTGRTEFYFGSLASIYEVFSSDDIGCAVKTLLNLGVSDGYPYENRKCRITKEPVIRKAQRQPSRQRKTDGQ